MPDHLLNKKVVLFTGCFDNYYYPEASEATVRVLRRAGVEVFVPEQVCCGLPMMTKGNVKGANKNIDFNSQVLGRMITRGYVAVSPCSSCSFFLKRDYTKLRSNELTELVSRNTYHITEYLLILHGKGVFDLGRNLSAQSVFYFEPCHLRAQQTGDVTPDLLKMIPGINVKHISRVCCGQAGAYGWERSNFERSSKISKQLELELNSVTADHIVTDCGGCKIRIESLCGRKVDHPLILLDKIGRRIAAG